MNVDQAPAGPGANGRPDHGGGGERVVAIVPRDYAVNCEPFQMHHAARMV